MQNANHARQVSEFIDYISNYTLLPNPHTIIFIISLSPKFMLEDCSVVFIELCSQIMINHKQILNPEIILTYIFPLIDYFLLFMNLSEFVNIDRHSLFLKP